MTAIEKIEIQCPHCQKVTFRLGEDIADKGKFVCPVCESDIFDTHIKPTIEAMRKYNSASAYFRDNAVRSWKGECREIVQGYIQDIEIPGSGHGSRRVPGRAILR